MGKVVNFEEAKRKKKKPYGLREQLDAIDAPYRQYLVLNIVMSAVVIGLTMLVAVMTKSIYMLIIGVMVGVGLFCIAYYRVLACTDGTTQVYEGTVISVGSRKKPLEPQLVFKMNDGTYIEIQKGVNTRKFKENDRVIAYTSYKSLIQSSENTYKANCVNYLYRRKMVTKGF